MGLRVFCEPDSETLTNRLVSGTGIQSKSVRNLGGVGGKAFHEPRSSGGEVPLTQTFSEFFSSIFFPGLFFRQFFFFLESSETYEKEIHDDHSCP